MNDRVGLVLVSASPVLSRERVRDRARVIFTNGERGTSGGGVNSRGVNGR